MTASVQEKVEAGAAIYTRLFLSMYDWGALGLHCRFLWACPSRHMLDMYHQHVTSNHLDIGVGTGYFLDHCRFPSLNPRIVLMDLNPNSLHTASRRLARYNPQVYRRNALAPFDLGIPPFDSIGIMNLLHCLPGDMNTKRAVLESAGAVLNPGGVIFGSTILYKGVKRHPLATLTLKLVNRKGIMTNMEDDVAVLKQNLSHHFARSEVRVVGCVALFWAQK
jgi:SAM-dependent methyltransferase